MRLLRLAAAVLWLVMILIASGCTNPPPPPPNRYTVDEINAILKEEEKKPPFNGEMNGIIFKQSIEAEDVGKPHCHPTDVAAEDIGETPLSVTSGDLPAGLKLTGMYASACDGEIFMIAAEYAATGRRVNISRRAFNAAISHTAVDRMHELTIVGKPAVLITEPPAVGSSHDGSDAPLRLIMREPFGTTEIRTAGITVAELLRLAESLD